MSQEKISIFGVRIDHIEDPAKMIAQHLANKEHYMRITTLNPEILLHARKDHRHRETLNSATCNIVDGIGIFFILALYGVRTSRTTGVDLMHMILTELNRRQGSVYLAVHAHGLSTWIEVKNVLEALYPEITFLGADIVPKDSMQHIDDISCDAVLCNFGSPEQEIFLAHVKNSQAVVGVGVGGAFDYVTGAVQRAPRWMHVIGLEWLYRLYQQPQRFMRIVRAVIIFPFLALYHVNKE